MRLTAKERILLHLLEYRKYAEELEVSRDITQEGIVKAAWVDLRHLMQYVRPLIREGLIRERNAHVKGGRRRRKVYDLTEGGRMAAVRLREKMKSEVIKVREADGVRNATLSEVLSMTGDKSSLLDIVHQVDELGAIDLKSIASPETGTFVEILSETPKVERFVGRSRELGAITREDGGARILVVRGVAGIGKSALGAKACELLHGKRNLFWHRIRPWDTRESILFQLGGFLAALGKPGLQAVLGRGETARAAAVLREDLPDTLSFLVFDDAHEATPETLQFFRILIEAVADASDVRVLVLTRKSLPFYNRRDVVLRRLVDEFDLESLESHEVAAYLSGFGSLPLQPDVAKKLRGHPLSLELLRSRNPTSAALKDARRYMEEEIYRSLSDAERSMMKLAAFYQVPVPQEALFAESAWSDSVFQALEERSLIRPVGEDRFEVHDTIREFFGSVLVPAEKREYARLAAAELRQLASEARGARRFALASAYLSNALRLTVSEDEQAILLEALGDAKFSAGDLLAASVAYRTAMRGTAQPERDARLHRKLAKAFEWWGEFKSAGEEVEAGFRALGDSPGPERGWLLMVRSRVLASTSEDLEEARKDAEEALRIFENSDDVNGLAETYLQLGKLSGTMGAMEEGGPVEERFLLSALDLSRRLGDEELIAEIHSELINSAGDAERAKERLAAAETIPLIHENPRVRLQFLKRRAYFLCGTIGDFPSGTRDLLEATHLAKQLRNDWEVAYAKYLLSVNASALVGGDLDEARRNMEEAATEFRRLGDRLAGNALQHLGLYRLMQADLIGFRRVLADLENLSRSWNATWPGHVKTLRAIDELTKGNWEKSEHIFKALLREVEALPPESELGRIERPRTHLLYGVALQTMGREADGQAYIQRAWEIFRVKNFLGFLRMTEVRAARLLEGLRALVESS